MSGNNILGLFDKKSIIPCIILVSNRILENDYKAVVLHELGHSLGLEHNEGINGIDTLMYPSIDLGSNHITFRDGQQFCKLYHCDPNKLKYQKEPFHF